MNFGIGSYTTNNKLNTYETQENGCENDKHHHARVSKARRCLFQVDPDEVDAVLNAADKKVVVINVHPQ